MPTFVVERQNWRRVGAHAWVRLPGENVVATFANHESAVAEASRSEAHARQVVGHPFRCGASLFEITTLPEFAFLDWLRDEGIEPPDAEAGGARPWFAWADLFRDEWSAGQLAHLWEGCNRVRFHFVREREADPLLCVVRVHWSQEMNDTNYLPETEGGTPVVLWHDGDRAEADGREKQRLAADEVAAALVANGDERLLFDPQRRLDAADQLSRSRKFPPCRRCRFTSPRTARCSRSIVGKRTWG